MGDIGLPDFCNAALTQTDSAGNAIHIAVWLPAKWNGRFQGIGGGGYSCGITYAADRRAGSQACPRARAGQGR